MRTLKIFFILNLFTSIAFATESDPGNGRISGSVSDKSTQNPIPYASVALVSKIDSTLITGVITDDAGKYAMSNIPYGTYNLKVSFVGYKTMTIEEVEISGKVRNVELGTAYITEDVTAIDEAVIKHERIKGEEKIDRTVFTINDDLRKASSSGLDMLKHIPSVAVDFQENVSVEGSTNIQFYVDGILRNKDYIAQLDPTMIDKIEVITNPGVKYEANIGAVLNIVLKKEKRYGVSGSVKPEITNPNVMLWNPRANIEFGTHKFRVYVGNRTHYERFDGSQNFRMDQVQPDGDVLTLIKNGEGRNQWSHNNLNYGFDIFLNDKTSINFYGDWNHHYSNMQNFLFETDTYLGDSLIQDMTINQNNKNFGNSYFYSLYVKRKLDDDGSEFTIEGNYYTYNSEENNRYEDSYFDTETSNLLSQVNRLELNLNNRQSAEFKAELTLIGDKLKHELGYHFYDQWMNNSFENDLSPIKGLFSYNEIRNSVYYSLSGKYEKITWQAGVRGEYSTIRIQEQERIDYGAFVPGFSVAYDLPEKQSIKLVFNRRIDRPSIGNLNPFEMYYDSLHVRTGNPELDPSYTNKLELSYNTSIKNNYISPKIYTQFTQNGFQEVRNIASSGVVESTVENIGRAMEYGGLVSFSWQFTEWLRLNGYGKVFNQIFYSDHENTLDDKKQHVSFEGNATTVVTLPKEFVFFAMVQRNGHSISYTGTNRRDMLFIVGLEKEVFKNGSVEMFYLPFRSKFTYSENTTETEGLYENWKGMVDVQHAFSVSFTYRFNYGKKVNKINRSTDYHKDSGQGGM